MRGVFLIGLLFTGLAFAQDARVSFLKKQLSQAKDPRLRAQTCTLLGKTHSEEAVSVLCGALSDKESVVRSAAAGALGDLKIPAGAACLKKLLNDDDTTVRKAVDRALGMFKRGGVYLAVEQVVDKAGGLPANVLELAQQLLKAKATSMGATLAPERETKQQASSVINKNAYRGYLMRSQLSPTAAGGLKIEILIMTYPEQALQGTWNVKASGAAHDKLLKVMVPKVVEDAASDLEWK